MRLAEELSGIGRPDTSPALPPHLADVPACLHKYAAIFERAAAEREAADEPALAD